MYETWFYVDTVADKIKCLPNSQPKPGSIKSKRFIAKFMFLCAVGTPTATWDGKIGIYPFTKWKAAKNNTANRSAGTKYQVSINVGSDWSQKEKYITDYLIKGPEKNSEKWFFEDPLLDEKLFLGTTNVISGMLISSSDEEKVDLI